jgi:hypothetical protein
MEQTKAPHYVIDGLNVCKYRASSTSLSILLTLVMELIRRRHSFICLFDAVTPYRLSDHEREQYVALLQALPDYFVEITGGIEADEFVLLQAASTNGIVISNDRFRKYAERYPWVQQKERLIKGSIIRDMLLVPDLAVHAPLLAGVSIVIRDLTMALQPIKNTSLIAEPKSVTSLERYRAMIRRAELLDTQNES